jgi:hypothetical protein
MNQEQLNQRFYLNRVDHNELLSLLQFHFGQSSHPALSRRHTFTKRDEEQISLDVEVDKYGQIFDIIPSQDFPDIELEAISSKIRNTLIDNQSIKIGEVVGFSVNGKVDGFFKYKEEFQILPVPDSAPKITHQTAGDHPFLLQFKYATCPDFQISSMRAKEKEIRILRMLNLLTKGRIKHVSPFVKSAWVAKIDDDPSSGRRSIFKRRTFTKAPLEMGQVLPTYQDFANHFFNCPLPTIPRKAPTNRDYKIAAAAKA